MAAEHPEGSGVIERLARAYLQALVALIVVAPSAGTAYLVLFLDPNLKFVAHDFHVVAVTGSIILAAFVTTVSFLCFRETGEPFLRWLTLAFLAFAILYFPHGALTHTADTNIWLFILYGPYSRLVMAGFLVAGLIAYDRGALPAAERSNPHRWLPWAILLLAGVLGIFELATSSFAGHPMVRWVGEGGAIGLCLVAIAMILARKQRPHALGFLAVALAMFAQSSAAFLLSKPWNHLWWYAHIVFAVGFFVLSYALIRAYLSTRSFSAVYNMEEMISRLAAASARAKSEERAADNLRKMLDLSPIGVVISDEEGRILYANQTMSAIVEVEAADLIGHRPSDLLAEACLNENLIRQASRTGEIRGQEIACRSATGERKWLLASLIRIDYQGRPAVVAWNLDITARHDAETVLRAAKDEAESANRSKSEFLASMSHELRTPLNAIIGFSDIIRGQAMGPVGTPVYLEYANDIQASGQHLLEMVNDILDVSKIETGQLDLIEEPLDLETLIGSVLRLVQDRAKRGEVSIATEIPASLPRLRADGRRVKQVVLNLLSNAIKFTPAGGSVTVSARRHDRDGMEIAVRDTGIGIATADIPKAMARFGQVDSALHRKFEGTGLGLPLAKSLMELHGGSLELTSEPGRGTTVTVRFPADRIVP
jgi:PAS domain S-box-containing protein